MKHPTTAWWCGYWKEAYLDRTDVVDRGVDCPTHERNDGGSAEDRGCRPVGLVPLPPEGTKRLVVVGEGEWEEGQRCPSCDGSGVTPEDHGQGMVEYLGCMDCWGFGVRPDALALGEDSP